MNAEEALVYLESLLPQAHLNTLQIAIFQQVWQNCSYLEIARNSGYGLSHIKQTGSELWQLLSQNLGEKVSKTNVQKVLKRYASSHQSAKATAAIAHPAPHCDWGEAADIPAFCGRLAELETLKEWVVNDRARLIGLFGMGGMGKTTLSIRLAQRIATNANQAQPFQFVVWRSLRNAPPLGDLLTDLVQALAPKQTVILPETPQAQIRGLLDRLKAHRCLIILDNAESLMRSHDCTGSFLPGYEGYAELLTAIGETRHSTLR